MAQMLSHSKRTTPPTPTDYTELFDNYYDYVQRLLYRAGIERQNLEDVSMSILLKFYEKDVLSDYSPEYKAVHNGVEKTATFMSFLSGFVLLYARHYRDRQNIMAKRSHAFPETDSEAPPAFPTAVVPEYDNLYMEDLVHTVSAHLNDVPRLPRARFDLSDLFPRVVRQVEENGAISSTELAAEFGVTSETIRNRLKDLRTEVKVALDES